MEQELELKIDLNIKALGISLIGQRPEQHNQSQEQQSV